MEKVKLGDICKIINGYAFKSNLYTDIGIRIIRITNVQKGYIEDNEPKFYPLDSQKDLEKYQLYKEDLLISLTGNVGRVGLLQEEMLPAALNQRVGCIRVLNESRLDKKYLFYALNNDMFEKKCMNNSKGIAQKNLSTEWLKEYQINLPPIKEQERIIEELDKLQQIIDIRKKQIEELDELINSQFVEMFGDPFNNPNNYKFIPFDKFMDRCVDIGSNGANKTIVDHLDMKDTEDYAMLIRTVNFTSNDFVNNMKYIDKEAYEFFSKSKVYGGEIIFNKIGSAGINFIVPQFNRPVSLGLNIIMVTPKEINTRYLYDFLNTEYGKYQIKIRTNGAVTKSIQKTKLKEIPIMYPDIKLQNKYEKVVKQIDKQKVNIQNSLKQTEELQASLMDKYF